MAKYKVEITEYLQRTIEVEADNESDAVFKVEENYHDAKEVLDYNRSLHEVVRQFGTLLIGIPKYILKAVEFMWRTIVIGSTGTMGIILTIAKLGLPSAAHRINIIKKESKGRERSFHYSVLFYSGYILL